MPSFLLALEKDEALALCLDPTLHKNNINYHDTWLTLPNMSAFARTKSTVVLVCNAVIMHTCMHLALSTENQLSAGKPPGLTTPLL